MGTNPIGELLKGICESYLNALHVHSKLAENYPLEGKKEGLLPQDLTVC
jgi:hypothetical protein